MKFKSAAIAAMAAAGGGGGAGLATGWPQFPQKRSRSVRTAWQCGHCPCQRTDTALQAEQT